MTFAQYVRDEIQAAEAELVCCILQHTPTHSSFFGDLLQYFLVYEFLPHVLPQSDCFARLTLAGHAQ
jgi:hypothetical protein